MEHYLDCPKCGHSIEIEDDLEIEIDENDYVNTGKITLDVDDAVDYIFLKMMKEGYAPRSAEIFMVIEYYQDYVEEQIVEWLKGAKFGNGIKKDDDNKSV